MRIFSLYFLLVALLLTTQAEATIINFDNLSADIAVTNQYPTATFSSTAGNTNWTFALDLGSSIPNFICTGPTSGGCTFVEPTYIDFTSPVHNLTFVGVGINDTDTVAQVRVFVNGNLDSTVDVIGEGNGSVVTVDLSAFQNVTRIEIVNITDTSGIGWDDFSFAAGSAGPVTVPTMTQWGMIIFMAFAGVGSIYYLRRQRKQIAKIDF